MHKECTPYEQALALKEIDFDEPCVYYVDKNNNSYIYDFQKHLNEFVEWCGGNVIKAPTFSQTFRWFRNKYKLVIDWNNLHQDNFGSYIGVCIKNKHLEETMVGVYKTYEEAELACLKKLIKIVKENK